MPKKSSNVQLKAATSDKLFMTDTWGIASAKIHLTYIYIYIYVEAFH